MYPDIMLRLLGSVLFVAVAVAAALSCSPQQEPGPGPGTSQDQAVQDISGAFTRLVSGARDFIATFSTGQNVKPALFVESELLENRNLETVYKDDFSDIKSGWPVNPSTEGGSGYESGEFSIWTKKPEQGQAAYSDAYVMPQDFAAEIDFKQAGGDENSAMGIMFRKSEGGDLYCLLVWGDRSYTCFKSQQGKRSFLMETTPSGALPRGNKTNQLGIVCIGPQIELFANGGRLQSFTDNETVTGPMNLQLVVTTNAPKETRYRFDNLIVYSVK